MNLKNLFFVLFPLLTFTTVSCGDCIGPFGGEKIVCNNGGTCNEGACDCLKGYSGEFCDSLDLCELNDVVCVFGECNNGDCFCQPGYEGERCETESRAKFIGRYRITEACNGLDTIENIEIGIERNLLNGEVMNLINVFNASQFPITGFFSPIQGQAESGAISFKINNQEPDGNGKTISGSGSIDLSDTANVTLSMDYTIVSGNKSYSCTAEGVKFE